MNPIHTFSGNITGLFPSLSVLDATGIVDWKPEKQLFQLRMLQPIRGLTWSRGCKNCTFYRANATYATTFSFKNHDSCHVFYYNVANFSPIIRYLKNSLFQVRDCVNTKQCEFSKSRWKETVAGMNFQSFLGFLGVLVKSR